MFEAVGATRPGVNVAALVGHTALRNNYMDRLDRAATSAEIEAMRGDLQEALDAGAIGLSTGLAYASANAASTAEEVDGACDAVGGSRRSVYDAHAD